MKRSFEMFYEEIPRLLVWLSEFGYIPYVPKREKIKKHMDDKTYKSNMVV